MRLTDLTLVLRSLRHRWRAHAGVALGAALGMAILVGALAVGDSVRASLRAMALERLGNVHYALVANDRTFAPELAKKLGDAMQAESGAILLLPGVAVNPQNQERANHVQVLGVNDQSWSLSHNGYGPELKPGEVAISFQLEDQLGLTWKNRDATMVLRVDKPSPLPRDAVLSAGDTDVAFNLQITRYVSPTTFGTFSLQAGPAVPLNAFVSLDQLSREVYRHPAVNVVLLGAAKDPTRAAAMVNGDWQLSSPRDAELEVRQLAVERWMTEVRSDRVFIDSPAVAAVMKAAAAVATTQPAAAEHVLTYMVNELRAGDRATPYSMVTGIGGADEPLVAGLGDDQLVINDWLANDLRVGVGDRIALKYFVLTPLRKLETRENSFTVARIVKLSDGGTAADRELMPNFPGIADAEKQGDWKPGFNFEPTKIRPQDEAYWKQYRGTPKAFVTLAAARKMWSNPYGDTTAIRFDAGAVPAAKLSDAIVRELKPASIGLVIQPIREQALAAASPTTDFGGLFLGLSFFLIVSALVLMGLLFAFGVQQRRVEVGTLLALGFPARRVRRLLLMEGVGIALVGGVIGTAAGLAYTALVLWGLRTIWRGAIGTMPVVFAVSPLSLAIGFFAGVLLAVGVIWLGVRRQAQQPARELLAGDAGAAEAPVQRRTWYPLHLAIIALAVASAVYCVIAAGHAQGEERAGMFLTGGAALLVAGLWLAWLVLTALANTRGKPSLSVARLGVRSSGRRRGRSLATVAMLATGCFLVIAIGAFRQSPPTAESARDPKSGTGGFTLYAESSLPILNDLGTPEGRDRALLPREPLDGVAIVGMRVHEGDDASCLNLNTPRAPRLLGVDPAQMPADAFTFLQRGAGWAMLNAKTSAGAATQPATDPPGAEVPAIVDNATLQWSLHRSVGDTLDYADERGRVVHVKIVASIADSILQGSLIVPADALKQMYPSASGQRVFLIRTPAPQRDVEVRAALARALSDQGLEITATADRLAMFQSVQNTYLSIFQSLGGLALALGSLGLGVVVLRNMLERRAELGVLRALGFGRGAIRSMVFAEHALLLGLGLCIGIGAALVSLLPALGEPGAVAGARSPLSSMVWTLVVIAVAGAAFTWLATVAATRGPLIAALREE